jgi:hypothetical protein
MEKKVCSKCKTEKELCEFQKNKHSKDGYRSECSECSKLMKKLKPKNIINQYHKNYRDKNREKYNEKQKKYYWNNKEKENERVKKYREKPEKIKNIYVPWRVKNKEVFNQKRRELYKTNVIFRLSQNIRNRMNTFISSNNFSKNGKTFELIGCSQIELRIYLENKFLPGMSWDNKGEWHIDHIIPLSSANCEEDIIILAHYTNLQPLWAKDNLKKKDKIIKT